MICADKYYVIITVVLVCLFSPFHAYAEDAPAEGRWVKLDVDLFHSNSKDTIEPAIILDLGPKNWESDERDAEVGSYYFLTGLKGRIIHVWDEELDNEPSWAELNAGIFWNMSDMEVAEGPPPMPGEEVADPRAYDFGRAGAGLHLQVETDDDGDNINLAGGVQVTYTPLTAFDDLLIPPPSALLAYEYVNPQSDKDREMVGAEVSDFSRLRAALLWNWDLGGKLASDRDYLRHLAFQFHYRYFKEFDQPAVWEERGFDDYDHVDARFRYILPHAQRKRFEIREFYAGYASGRQIAHAQDDDRIIIGVTLQ